jgi:protein SCO1
LPARTPVKPWHPAPLAALLLAALALPAAAAPATAPAPDFQRSEPLPRELRDVGITEHLNQPVPLDAMLCDEQGKPVRLRDYVRGDKPVILNLGYYGCPMLCGLVINGLVASLQELSFTPGEQFEVVTVSINPAEKFPLAAAKKKNVMEELARPAAAKGWHFLTGDEAPVRQLADAVGFGYRWDPAQRQFIHAAVLIVLTPDGRVSRYLYGVQFPAKTLRLSLVEAGEGRIGSTADQLLLYCFHYDPDRGSYTLAALNLMRLGGVLTVLALAGLIARALRREFRRRGEEVQDPKPKVRKRAPASQQPLTTNHHPPTTLS